MTGFKKTIAMHLPHSSLFQQAENQTTTVADTASTIPNMTISTNSKLLQDAPQTASFQQKDILRPTVLQTIFASFFSSSVGSVITHPLFMAITQRQAGNTSPYVAIMKENIQRHGIIGIYKKGLPSTLVGKGSQRIVKFTVTAELINEFTNGQPKTATPWTHAFAGFWTGLTEGLLTQFFERIRVWQSLNKTSKKSDLGVFKTIWNNGKGARDLFRGFGANTATKTAFTSPFFGVAELLRSWFPKTGNTITDTATATAIGFGSSYVGIVACNPFDLVKTNTMKTTVEPAPVFSIFSTAKKLVAERGLKSLFFQGTGGKIAKLGPEMAIMTGGMHVFEEFWRHWNERNT